MGSQKPKSCSYGGGLWHHRNITMIFNTGKESIAHSVRFISNYFDSMQAIKNGTLNTERKRKAHVYAIKACSEDKAATQAVQTWKRPQQGWTQINFDASFLKDKSREAWVAVAGAQNGSFVFSAWIIISQYGRPENQPTCLAATRASSFPGAAPCSILL
jgi:hypothetical protein